MALGAGAVIRSGRPPIQKGSSEKNQLDINEIIQEVLDLTDRELYENRVEIERQLTEPIPCVLGDRVELQQVVLNLVMNGIEAMTAVTNRRRLLWVQSGIGESGTC